MKTTLALVTMMMMGIVGCGGAAHDEPTAIVGQASSAAGTLAPEEATAHCVRLHEQLATCSGEFIDMNLDLRAKYFPEFAKQLASPEARAEIRKEGIAEAIADGTGPIGPRQERCKEYTEHGPKVPRGEVAEAEACFQKASCAEKIACLRPSQEVRYSSRAAAPGDSTPEGAPKMK
jgi:hypothetical protein